MSLHKVKQQQQKHGYLNATYAKRSHEVHRAILK